MATCCNKLKCLNFINIASSFFICEEKQHFVNTVTNPGDIEVSIRIDKKYMFHIRFFCVQVQTLGPTSICPTRLTRVSFMEMKVRQAKCKKFHT